MTQNAPDNQAPPLRAFDWEGLPLQRTTQALAALGAALLEHALDPSRHPEPSLWLAFRWHKAMAQNAFPGSRHFRPAAPPPRRRPLKHPVRRALHGLLARAQLSITAAPPEEDHRIIRYWLPLTKHAMRGTLSESTRGRLMTQLMARRFFGADAYLLPRFLWRTATELAFEAPRFRLHVARTLDQFLRPRMTLLPELPPFELSIPTFWLLIALYQPTKPPWWRWLDPRWHRLVEIIDTLAAQAHLQSRSTGWAGFWDQWLLLHRLQAEPDAILRLNPLLRLAITRLPLLSATTLELHPAKTDATSIDLAHPDWTRMSARPFLNLYPSNLWEAPHV